ncbi:hypothetical protein NQZ68_011424 [Dissostichus eleginoides]|nr:hypothetical protein NQZ68_011424 [Dissostichus eleginoides]
MSGQESSWKRLNAPWEDEKEWMKDSFGNIVKRMSPDKSKESLDLFSRAFSHINETQLERAVPSCVATVAKLD